MTQPRASDRGRFGSRQLRQRPAGDFDLALQLRGQLAERVAALRFLGLDLLLELVEFAGAQGGDLVLGGGEALFQLRDLANQADQLGPHVFAGDGFRTPFVVVQQGLDPGEVAVAVGGVEGGHGLVAVVAVGVVVGAVGVDAGGGLAVEGLEFRRRDDGFGFPGGCLGLFPRVFGTGAGFLGLTPGDGVVRRLAGAQFGEAGFEVVEFAVAGPTARR